MTPVTPQTVAEAFDAIIGHNYSAAEIESLMAEATGSTAVTDALGTGALLAETLGAPELAALPVAALAAPAIVPLLAVGTAILIIPGLKEALWGLVHDVWDALGSIFSPDIPDLRKVSRDAVAGIDAVRKAGAKSRGEVVTAARVWLAPQPPVSASQTSPPLRLIAPWLQNMVTLSSLGKLQLPALLAEVSGQLAPSVRTNLAQLGEVAAQTAGIPAIVYLDSGVTDADMGALTAIAIAAALDTTPAKLFPPPVVPAPPVRPTPQPVSGSQTAIAAQVSAALQAAADGVVKAVVTTAADLSPQTKRVYASSPDAVLVPLRQNLADITSGLEGELSAQYNALADAIGGITATVRDVAEGFSRAVGSFVGTTFPTTVAELQNATRTVAAGAAAADSAVAQDSETRDSELLQALTGLAAGIVAPLQSTVGWIAGTALPGLSENIAGIGSYVAGPLLSGVESEAVFGTQLAAIVGAQGATLAKFGWAADTDVKDCIRNLCRNLSGIASMLAPDMWDPLAAALMARAGLNPATALGFFADSIGYLLETV